MTSDGDGIAVVDNPAAARYEAHVDDQIAFITYRRTEGRIVFLHTEVPPALQGHRIAGRMTQVALDEARAAGLAVIPQCPYVAAYLRRHPEYADLVPPEAQAHYLG